MTGVCRPAYRHRAAAGSTLPTAPARSSDSREAQAVEGIAPASRAAGGITYPPGMTLDEVLANVAARIAAGRIDEGQDLIERIAGRTFAATPRPALSTTKRAEVWSRDGFLCRYCGRRA